MQDARKLMQGASTTNTRRKQNAFWEMRSTLRATTQKSADRISQKPEITPNAFSFMLMQLTIQ